MKRLSRLTKTSDKSDAGDKTGKPGGKSGKGGIKQETRNSFKVRAKLKGSLSNIMKELSHLGFTSLELKKNQIIAMSVEREDIRGRPYLYIKFSFDKDGITVEYTSPPEVNKDKRLLDVVILTFKVLLLLKEYDVHWEDLFSMVLNVLSVADNLFTDNYSTLLNKYQLLKEDYDKVKKERDELYKVLDKNNSKMAQMEKEMDQLRARISKLEGMSDDVLKEELLIWLRNHQGKINVSEFAKIYNISPARVEEGLDLLLKGGYIAKAR